MMSFYYGMLTLTLELVNIARCVRMSTNNLFIHSCKPVVKETKIFNIKKKKFSLECSISLKTEVFKKYLKIMDF